MSDTMQTHGALSWAELHTQDVAKAKAFYTEVIGWEAEDMPMPDGNYTVLKANGAPVVGMTSMGAEGEPAWSTYITVDDVDKRVEMAKKAGGNVVMPAMTVPGVGRMAAIVDAVGAAIYFITYEAKD